MRIVGASNSKNNIMLPYTPPPIQMFFLNIVLQNDLNNNHPPTLTKDEIEYMKTLLHEKPEVFEEISREINEILDNGKIDLHEIPQIVLLISKIYSNNMTTNTTTTRINLPNIIRYTVEFILDMETLPYNADLATMKNVIDSSIDLLNMNLGHNENCFSLFRGFC